MKRTTKTLFNICPSCFLMLTELETWQNFSCMGIPLCFSAIIMKKGNFSDFCLLPRQQTLQKKVSTLQKLVYPGENSYTTCPLLIREVI